jgi:hypothetical protein|tara:strand:+ start:788 stop:988 length:201 start_codon:yes stop_codon:yes gene_type:complete
MLDYQEDDLEETSHNPYNPPSFHQEQKTRDFIEEPEVDWAGFFLVVAIFAISAMSVISILAGTRWL